MGKTDGFPVKIFPTKPIQWTFSGVHMGPRLPINQLGFPRKDTAENYATNLFGDAPVWEGKPL